MKDKSDSNEKKPKKITSKTFSSVTKELLSQHSEFSKKVSFTVYPNVDNIIRVIKKIRAAIFPGYFKKSFGSKPLDSWLEVTLAEIYDQAAGEIKTAFLKIHDSHEASRIAGEVTESLIRELALLQEALYKDAEAGFDGDPAAQSVEEVILTYPGFYAVLIYRIANFLFKKEVPYIPRIMSEYAHNVTGIDIHPGAEIGEYFFIDHGTGVVIGETSVIGNHVKLYQGVTLGALSTRSGQKLAGKKRHPTIEDNVTIYSGASILGGQTVIGKNSTIGGNAFVIKSVAPDTTVKGI